MQEKITGLTRQEVTQKIAAGKGQSMPRSITKSKKRIFWENIVTLFNFLNFTIAAFLFAVGAYSNMLFIAIIILNIVIGIVQELKAKKLVDELSILNRPQVTVVRDGKESVIAMDEIVEGDVTVLESGRQICNDALVLAGEIEVNESLLTGESDPVIKGKGDELLSGSSVISGKCFARVIHVGSENYATKLAEEVKKEKNVESELLGSMRKVTRFTSFLIIPLGIMLFIEAMVLRGALFDAAVVSSAAALLGMLPKGLVLLISVSLANGVIRMSKQKILVQNIYSLETLAHVDTLCLDKTGTLTDGRIKVKDVFFNSVNERDGMSCMDTNFTREKAEKLFSSYLAAADDNNATMQALRDGFPVCQYFEDSGKIPFSSKRKWGAVSFKGIGTLFVGAPEKIADKYPKEAERRLQEGYRMIAVGFSNDIWKDTENLPERLQPLFIISMEDRIRKNAEQTLEYFRREGVDVKIISGDHVKTVSMVAKKAGLDNWYDSFDMSKAGDETDYSRLVSEYSVFARVTPRQKQELVKAMKDIGRCVAMTGDGVNDLLALREADCSIAIAEGSDASKQISQIVLLDSDFTYLPRVVLEGRKVVNNVTRTAGVFFIKTIYSVLVSLFCLIGNIPFPFIPIQITLVDAFMEAWPSFATIIESDTRKIRGSFLKSSIGNALPFALAVSAVIVFTNIYMPFSYAQSQTVMYLLLILLTMASVVKSCIPFSKLRIFICTVMMSGTCGALYIFPSLFEITAVNPVMAAAVMMLFVAGLAVVFIITALQKRHKDFLYSV